MEFRIKKYIALNGQSLFGNRQQEDIQKAKKLWLEYKNVKAGINNGFNKKI